MFRRVLLFCLFLTLPATSVLALTLRLGLAVTALRARHRSRTLMALVGRRAWLPLLQEPAPPVEDTLAQAAEYRRQALLLVRAQEQGYRYPRAELVERQHNLTVYDFGYLMPVHDLFFWQREEAQVATGRCDPFFRKLWDFRRTLGLGSLLCDP